MTQLKNKPVAFVIVVFFCWSCTDGNLDLLYSLSGTDSNADSDTVCGDADEDGQCDEMDPCPFDFNNDLDSDGLCGNLDNCVAIANEDQADDDTDNVGNVCDPCSTVSDELQLPYQGTVHQIPGIIELEFYDEGGPCVAYLDQDTENRADSDPFRTDEGVDAHGQQVETAGDYVVGYTYAGEWVEYTVDAAPGVYNIELYYSSQMDTDATGNVDLRLNEVLLGTFTFPDTGAFIQFDRALLFAVPIPYTRDGMLRLIFNERYVNYSRISFTAQ